MKRIKQFNYEDQKITFEFSDSKGKRNYPFNKL
jgi:hypothetical protein